MKYPSLIAFLLFFSLTIKAQDIQVVTEISNDTILYGNVFNVRFTAKNIQVKFTAPEFEDLQIISGPNVSTSMQFINGKMSSTMSYEYIVKPSDIGEYFIGPAYFESQDTVLETSPINIIVIPNPESIRQDNRKYKLLDDQSITAPEGEKKKKLKTKKRKI